MSLHIIPQHVCIFLYMDEMDGPQEAGKRLNGHVELGLCVSHGRCKDSRRKEEWVASFYGLSDPGLGSIEVAACDAHGALVE